MRVVRGPIYTAFDKNVVPDFRHVTQGYYPTVHRDEAETRGPVTAGMMEALGHSKWRLALILYEQKKEYDEVYPRLEVFRFEGVKGFWEPNIRVRRKYRPIWWDKVQFYGTFVMDEVEENLLSLNTGPQFAVLCSFEFPAHTSYMPTKRYDSNIVPGHKYFSTDMFAYRAFFDLPEHFRRSKDPELANAAVLAEMVV